MGRVAAIVAAAIAGIASLPALLGGGAPPPVPDDVGLTPTPVATVPPRPEPGAAPPPRAPRPAKPHQPRPAHRPVRHQPGQPQHHRAPATDPQTSEAPSPVYAPGTVYTPPPAPGEFRFER